MLKHCQNDFEKLYTKYSSKIYGYCFFRVSPKGLAEELSQETFLRLWEYMRAKHKIINAKAFLYKTAHNLVVDSYRKKANRKEESLDAVEFKSRNILFLCDQQSNLEREILLKQAICAMKNLSQDYREILTMRYIDGLSLNDIALILDINSKKVSKKIKKAVIELRGYL